MRLASLTLLTFAFILCTPAFAQDAPVTEVEQAPPAGEPAPVEEAPAPKPPEYEDMPQVELRILDKVRAESKTYVLNVGRTVAYANIRIRPRACRTSSPLDDPEDAAFLQIWEVKPDNTSGWIFSGWMFASSPSLSAMDHPVYDVSVLDCKNPDAKPEETPAEDEAKPQDDAETAPEEAPAADAPATPESTKETPSSDKAPASAE
jgi:hypothetical protein